MLAPFVNNLVFRLIVAMVIAVSAAQLTADFVESAMVPGTTEGVARHLASEIKLGRSSVPHMLDLCRSYGLAFCFITNDKNSRPTPETEALAGNFKMLPQRGGIMRVADKAYYHAVADLPHDQTLHVGMSTGDPVSWADATREPLLFLFSRRDQLHLVIATIFSLLAAIFVSFFSVTRPAGLMANLPFSDEKEKEKKYRAASLGAGYEVQHMYKAFMAYSKTTRSDKPKTTDFQKPIGMRIDEALLRKQQGSSYENLAAISIAGESSTVYRSLENKLTDCTEIREFRETLLNGLAHMNFKYCMLLQQGGDSAVAATIYVDHRALQLLSAIDHSAIVKLIGETNKSMDIGAMSLRRYGFGMLTEYMQLKNVRYIPVKHHGSLIAVLVVLFDAKMPEMPPDALIDLESFCSRMGGMLANMMKKQELEDASMKDQLTGLPNRKFLQDFLAERLLMGSKDGYRSPLSLMIMQPNISDAVIAKHGEAIRDKILQELAQGLQQGVKAGVDAKSLSQVVRYDIEEFAICVQPLDEAEALELGKSLQQRISKSKASLGDMFGVTLTVGVATSPVDAKDERALLSRAKLAMRFAEELRPEIQIANAREVPVSYEPSKRLADISGELGVLDCAALLQSIGNSQKTGVLTVEEEVGRQFQSTFRMGKLISSTLEEFREMDAVVEFVTSFEAGRYNFRLVSDTELDKMAGHITEPHPPLDKCLMEAALAEDHLKKAKKHLRETFLMRATPGDDAREKWQRLETDTRNYNLAERQTMQKILMLADGSRTLGRIFSEIDPAPTYLKWHAAAILSDHRLLQSKKVS